MSNREPLLDPTGDSERDTNTALAQPRPQSLRGLTAGLLDNTKPNGAVILAAVGRELMEHYGVREVRLFAKSYFGTPRRSTRPWPAACRSTSRLSWPPGTRSSATAGCPGRSGSRPPGRHRSRW
jgi:hypothetical protein